MCDYGVGRNLTPTELEKALEETLRPALSGVKTILFGSYGSVLDEYEISSECLDVILDFVSKCSFDNIIFETHYSTVTLEKLIKIKKYRLPKVWSEIGNGKKLLILIFTVTVLLSIILMTDVMGEGYISDAISDRISELISTR